MIIDLIILFLRGMDRLKGGWLDSFGTWSYFSWAKWEDGGADEGTLGIVLPKHIQFHMSANLINICRPMKQLLS